jgi:peptidoglycan/LPS O-acetylase OafA/YrhL
MSDTLSLPLPSKNVERIDGLQVLRMVAVLLVAWAHAAQPIASTLPHFGIFGVDIFFVISGFILALIVLRDSHTPGFRPSIDFLRRRAVRIFPVYWLFALLPFVHRVHAHQGLTYFPAILLLPGPQYFDLPVLANFSWTLIFEMFFYLLFGAMLLFWSQQRAVKRMIAALVVLVTAGAFLDIGHPVVIVVMNPILLEFAMGALAALIYSREGSHPWIGRILIALGIGLSLVLRRRPADRGEWDILMNHGAMERAYTWGVAAALIVLGMVLLSPRMESPLGRLSVLLGNASYSTYLLSGFLLLKFSLSIAKLRQFVHGPVSTFFMQVAITSALMILGLTFYLVVEKRLLAIASRLIPGR